MLGGEMISVKSIQDYLSSELLGVLPEDDEVSRQLMLGGHIDKDSFEEL